MTKRVKLRPVMKARQMCVHNREIEFSVNFACKYSTRLGLRSLDIECNQYFLPREKKAHPDFRVKCESRTHFRLRQVFRLTFPRQEHLSFTVDSYQTSFPSSDKFPI